LAKTLISRITSSSDNAAILNVLKDYGVFADQGDTDEPGYYMEGEVNKTNGKVKVDLSGY
jgi:hypothetical protein